MTVVSSPDEHSRYDRFHFMRRCHRKNARKSDPGRIAAAVSSDQIDFQTREPPARSSSIRPTRILSGARNGKAYATALGLAVKASPGLAPRKVSRMAEWPDWQPAGGND